MFKYLIKRLLHAAVSVILVVGIVMILIYSLMDKNTIFQHDERWTKISNNVKEEYKYQRWERYGYVDYISYSQYLDILVMNNEITQEKKEEVVNFGYDDTYDTEEVHEYVQKFRKTYAKKGYKVVRLKALRLSEDSDILKKDGEQKLFAYKNLNIFNRMWNYFTGIISIDNIHYADEVVGRRGISFTFFDPVYGGKKFSPAIMGNGTKHKYLLYFDNKFPFIHQNLIQFKLGTSYSVSEGVDIADYMTQEQGRIVSKTVYYPTGYVEKSSDNLHDLVYISNSNNDAFMQERFVDNYTNTGTYKMGNSMIEYSFIIGLIATIISYLLAVPLGILMARKKDKLADKIGTIYIVFIMAVPSLAYIFMFRQVGSSLFGLPTTFDTNTSNILVYFLPIISLALPAIAGLMKWLRRYMIDQMNSDYVKFARAGGLSETEIFTKHIFKNAAIPIVQGIPASILACLTGAIITESVYTVPGSGKLLTDAIHATDNGVIVGLTFFYAILSVISLILGDILMAMFDPRISFSTKGR